MDVSISSDLQPASVLVWERSGHHGDETDYIICSVAVWHKGLHDGRKDRQAAGWDMSSYGIRGRVCHLWCNLICYVCNCVSAVMSRVFVDTCFKGRCAGKCLKAVCNFKITQILVCLWACGVVWNWFFSDVGAFSGVYLLLWERAAMTFSGNNRDIKAEIMEETRRNQRSVKLNVQQTTLSGHGEG